MNATIQPREHPRPAPQPGLAAIGRIPRPAVFANTPLRVAFLFSLAMAALLPVYVYLSIFPAFQRALVQNTEEQAIRVANHIALDLTRGPSGHDLDRALQAQMLHVKQDMELWKLRLYDIEGTILFSSLDTETGTRPPDKILGQVVAGGKPYSQLEKKGGLTPEGEPVLRDVVETYVPIRRDGRVTGVFEVYSDVSERASLQGQLLRDAGLTMLAGVAGLLLFLGYIMRRSERGLKEVATVFDANSNAILITDANGIIRRINAAFTEITGYSTEEVIGRNPRMFKSGRHDEVFYREMWRSLRDNGRWEGEIFNRRKDGSIYPEWQHIDAMKDEHGRVTGYLSQFSDVARRRLTEQEVRYRANYDALTGLPNRGLLMERLDHAIREAERLGKRVAVMFTDLDHFKQINDTLGHEIGDLLLQEVAAYLKSCVRPLDTVARQGGDEFVLVLPAVDDAAHARSVAEKILARFSGPIPLPGHKIHITSSVGIAIYPEDGRDIQALFRNADMAMYRAKETGRNGFRCYEPAMSEAAQAQHRMQCDLRQSLERNELFMHYQPIVALPSGRVEGVEALMRWNQPERGPIPPDRFIPLAEEMGLIHEMFRHAMEEVCAQLAQWRRQGLDLYATINVSGRQIPDSLPPVRLAEVVARHGLKPTDLVLEITEGVLIQNIEKAQGWLDAVQAMGFRVALDDFGTGFSSLSYLKRLNLDMVKIDKAFVRDMGMDENNLALVQTVVTLGHLMKLRVVAEGVETAWDLAKLQAMGCDYVQGYHLAKPMPPEEIAAFVGERASPPDDVAAQPAWANNALVGASLPPKGTSFGSPALIQ